jgi:hypothetical protein
MMAARSLWRLDKLEEARKVARVAVTLAADDANAKAQAEQLLERIPEPPPKLSTEFGTPPPIVTKP